MQEEVVVRVENLSHRYNTTQWAIQNINFEIKRKGVLGLLGSNGAGKSTAMNIMCGVLNQTAGEVYINGVNLRENPVKAKRHIGFLPQKPPLHMDLTVDEYLVHCASVRLMAWRNVRKAVEEVKERCAISHFSKRLVKNLSGGYQQRLGIAQAIIHKPEFVVLDEPTNGLDPNQIVEIRHLVREIAEERCVILSTHILPEVQATCNQIKMIEHGKLVFSGSMEDFDNCIIPNTLAITLNNPPPTEKLKQIEGVRNVECLSDKKFRLQFSETPDIAGKIVELSVIKGWQLHEIILEKNSLDAIFAKLSEKEYKS